MMIIVAEPCGCRRMKEALVDGEIVMGVVENDGVMATVIGIRTIKPEPSGINPITYCPWCGNAACQIKDAS